jgi:hypothetical protein
MAKKYPYARWANDRIKKVIPEEQQSARARYFSDSGRIQHYDEYARWSRLFGYDFDDNPEGYWESKFLPWHKPTGILLGALGTMTWLLLQVIAGSTGRKER